MIEVKGVKKTSFCIIVTYWKLTSKTCLREISPNLWHLQVVFSFYRLGILHDKIYHCIFKGSYLIFCLIWSCIRAITIIFSVLDGTCSTETFWTYNYDAILSPLIVWQSFVFDWLSGFNLCTSAHFLRHFIQFLTNVHVYW